MVAEWLLEDADLSLITNNYEWDWVLEKFISNGITSPSDARMRFENTRFEYSYPDCPKCGLVDKHYQLNFEAWKCKGCGLNFSITAQTYIDNTKLEYYQWFRFCYLLGGLKITNSSVIAQDIQVTQKTSWWMLETIRTARKESTEKKFVNGNEVLAFNHLYEPLQLLLKVKNQPQINFPSAIV